MDQARRQRAAWHAHSEQVTALEEMSPGGNEPGFGNALKCYRSALGLSFDEMNVIELGVYGSRIDAYAARADETFLEDIVGNELIRSLSNILSGMYEKFVRLARETGSKAREGWLTGTGKLFEKLPYVLAFGTSETLATLISGYPSVFGWIENVVRLLFKTFGG